MVYGCLLCSFEANIIIMTKREYTCGSFIVNTDNQLLVIHPTGAKRNFWSIPKGRSEFGESYENAAERELFEETGLTTAHVYGALVSKQELEAQPYTKRQKTLIPFLYIIDNSLNNFPFYCEIKPDDNGKPEADDFAWVSIEKAKKILHYTQVRVLLEIEKKIYSIVPQFE